jgi:hypothetical protein
MAADPYRHHTVLLEISISHFCKKKVPKFYAIQPAFQERVGYKKCNWPRNPSQIQSRPVALAASLIRWRPIGRCRHRPPPLASSYPRDGIGAPGGRMTGLSASPRPARRASGGVWVEASMAVDVAPDPLLYLASIGQPCPTRSPPSPDRTASPPLLPPPTPHPLLHLARSGLGGIGSCGYFLCFCLSCCCMELVFKSVLEKVTPRQRLGTMRWTNASPRA